MASSVLRNGAGPVHGTHYVVSSPTTDSWGWIPHAGAAPVLDVADGDTVTVDCVSSEGLMDDQGRDPVTWFGAHGVAAVDVLPDAVAFAREHPARTPLAGPHVLLGPIAVRGARVGDVLVVDVLSALRRVPYGVVSSRDGRGALAGELPVAGAEVDPTAGGTRGGVSTFCRVEEIADRAYGRIDAGGRAIRFPLSEFMGIMAVATATEEPVSSVPPGAHGGNIDLKHLVAGTRLFLPVLVDGALFSMGDPHFAQGNGEVALTALEAPLRTTIRLSVLRGDAARRATGALTSPFVETDTHWIVLGLHQDLDEAMRAATRSALQFLSERFGLERHTGYAYLSAAADFEVTQVVDLVKGVHCILRKADFAAW